MQEENPCSNTPSVSWKDAEIVLRQSESKNMNEDAVNNVLMLIEVRITSALQSCTAEDRPSLIGAVVTNTIATVMDKQVGVGMLSELVKDAESQAVSSQGVVVTVVHKLISSDELMEPVTPFVSKTVEKGTGNVKNVYNTEEKVDEVLSSPTLSESSDFESSRSSRRPRRN